jgi:zinc transport system permease protein
MPDFLLQALIAGLAVAVIAGPLGAFVVWQRLAYFGDTLAHSALLGVALGLWLSIDTTLAVIVSCIGIALLLTVLQRRPDLATDSLLGILSHGSLAIGLVAVALMDNQRLDLNAYLFGDLLVVSTNELSLIVAVAIVLLGLLLRFWRPLLAITVHAELAQVEGIAVSRYQLLLMLMIALLVAVAMKVIGVLLITALLIIPASSARQLSRSPEQMALLASLLGALAVIAGLSASMQWDTPAGASIVVAAVLLFSLLRCMPSRRTR